jgi:uridine phosphorylase
MQIRNDIEAPIIEYSQEREAIIEPSRLTTPVALPPKALLCFFPDVLTKLEQEGRLKVIYTHPTEMGPRPVYRLMCQDQAITVVHPGCGASYGALMFERLIAWGAKTLIACGGAGVIDRDFPMGALLIAKAAIRDEGTSYHYLPPAAEILLDPAGVENLAATLSAAGLTYERVKTWTTDGFYRETRERCARRVAQGCQAVDMECAAFAAIAQFRSVKFAQLLYSGDSLVGPQWQNRQWMNQTELREQIFDLAATALANWRLD